MISLKNQKNHRYRPGNMKITNDLTNLTTPILILTLQMFFEWALRKNTTENTMRDMESWAVCYCHFKKCYYY
jgi:hypothetical protein